MSFVKESRGARVLPVFLAGVVLLMVAPIPAIVLDLLLAASIALSLALLLVSLSIKEPLEFSSFPTVLLFATLFRLALNVAATRLILLHGGEGSDAAGGLIHAFGSLLVGGNYAVGATLFLLLVVINFVVITKGAGRVAEVSARFTLDALPGKQIAIDADLAAGALTQDEARLRRRAVEQESEFFGSMDGASKFVRGDAIAALVITGINIVVGFIVGVAQQGLPPLEAAKTYTVLTIGDGLASQVPALLLSTAAGVVVTRASGGVAIAPAILEQVAGRRQVLQVTATMLGLASLLPGVPMIPFLLIGGALYLASRSLPRPDQRAESEAPRSGQPEPTERERLEEMLPVDLLELEVGFELLSLVDASRGGELVDRIASIRRNLALETGLIIPAIQIRDNLRLKPNAYRILLSGNEIGRGDLRVGKLLAMDPAGALPPIAGEQTKEPAFGLPSLWIARGDREKAESLGYTVVDPPTVAATHLTETLRNVSAELLGRTDAQDLIDILARREPKLVDELIPNILTLGEVIRVLRSLLQEGVPIRDLRTIFEALAEHGRATKDPSELVEKARQRLARHLTSRVRGSDNSVAALVLDPRAEEVFRKAALDASAAQRLLGSLDAAARSFASLQTPPVLLCAPDVRRSVSDFLSKRVPGLAVMSYREIEPRVTVRNIGAVSV